MDISSEQLHTLYKKLPPEMRSVEFTERASGAIRTSAEKNKWSPEQTRVFAETIWKTIIGALPKEKIAAELAVRLSLPPEQARKVAGEVEKEIFEKAGGSKSPPLLRGSTPSEARGEGVSSSATTPPSASGGHLPLGKGQEELKSQNLSISKPPNLPTPPRPVLIRKPAPLLPPPASSAGRRGGDLQTLLGDIRRGTAYDENRINDAFRKTPIEVRQTLESVGFLSRLENIAKKFGLNVEETGELVSESGLVMLGLTLPIHFVDNLGKRLRLPRDRAMAVGQAVNMEVLRPVREILRKMGQPIQNTPPLPPSQARGTPPYQGGEAEKQSRYTSDPYREPLE